LISISKREEQGGVRVGAGYEVKKEPRRGGRREVQTEAVLLFVSTTTKLTLVLMRSVAGEYRRVEDG
jgi:hypothetical protein